jgi:hypothetical protein
MLRRLTPKDILADLSRQWEKTLADEWMAAIQSITSAVVLRNLVAEIERGNIEAALRMLDIGPDRFARFEGAIVQAYNAGGIAEVNAMPRLRDPSGLEWIR